MTRDQEYGKIYAEEFAKATGEGCGYDEAQKRAEAAARRDHRPQWITHATVTLDEQDAFDFMGPRTIVLKYEKSIVVPTHYAEKVPSVGKLIGTLDIEGNGLMEVPLIICKFHTEEEAETIERCMAADQQLLSYARG